MAIHHHEETRTDSAADTDSIQPDYLRLYLPNSYVPSDSGAVEADASETEPDSLVDVSIEKDPAVVKMVEGVKSHAAIAREGLEMVAAQNPRVKVNETHKIIRDEQARRVRKALSRLRRNNAE